jgi:predicted ester cyclase
VGGVRRSFPDLRVAIRHLVVEGPRVACPWRATGSQRGIYHVVPPTGAEVTFDGTSFFVVERGRVVDMVLSWDRLEVLMQLRKALNQ